MITFAELKNKSSETYPAILLEHFLPYRNRKKVLKMLLWFLLLFFVLIIIGPISFNFTEETIFRLRSAFFLSFSVWICIQLFDSFYLSYYFKSTKVNFEVAKLIQLSNRQDLLFDFLNSVIGKYTMMRLGISEEIISKFLEKREHKITDLEIDILVNPDDEVTLKDYAHSLYKADKEFSHFLDMHSISENLFIGSLSWVNQNQFKIRSAERWWSRESLSRIQSIGRNWSFGKIYLLEKNGHQIMSDSIYKNLGDKWRIYKDKVEQIEQVLIKQKGANVMLVSPSNETGLEIISSLGKMILNGKVLTELEDRRIFVLDGGNIIDTSKDKITFENSFKEILIQANNAGNVILVLPQLNNFIQSAHNISVDVATVLSEFLISSNIQLIATVNKKGFHDTVETNSDLMSHFEKILINEIDKNSAVTVLQDSTYIIEAKYNVFFTYQSLDEISKSAEQYYMGSNYSDKILDLLQEAATKAKAEKRQLITREDILELVSIKTGIPQGNVTEEEKDKLVDLENILHKRVIGQNEAVTAIADSMRRSRAGITNPKRPIGSFIFLGPTGVGKTETTKALAESFFGDEKKMIRFDMSEYAGFDSVNKISGIMADKVRDQQYGVFLLDEFEKTSTEVKDLFLQILDEGQFTDERGELINMRNLIIIATSNAGSEMIYEATSNGKEFSGIKTSVVDGIIKQNIFKPELINRFDGTILFHSLMPNHLREISKLMIKKLNNRLVQKGISINTSDQLLDYLVKIGNDRKFGARAINRVIQDNVEKIIANEIISGNLKSGQNISFKVVEGDLLEISESGNIINS